jgi:hypothetical protein
MESQNQGEYPFSIDVKGGDIADRGRMADTRRVAN